MAVKAIAVIVGIALSAALAGCVVSNVNGVPEPRPAPDSNIETGRVLIANYGCGTCHSIPGIAGADSIAAPPLDRFYERTYIAGRLPNTWENLTQWIQDPQGIEPGTAMPNLGITPDEARDLAAYLYHQPSLADWIHR